jgi:hypothetical protein
MLLNFFGYQKFGAAVHRTPDPLPSTNHILNKYRSSNNKFNHSQKNSYAIKKKLGRA